MITRFQDTGGLGLTRRRRKAERMRVILVWGALVLLYVLSLGVAYQVAISQSRAEIGLLMASLDEARLRASTLNAELATARARVEIAETRSEQLLDRLSQLRPPPPQVRAITATIEERLAEGMPPDRLDRIVRYAPLEQVCSDRTETRQLLVWTPLDREGTSASLAGGDFTLRASGPSARSEDGRPQAWFDPALPLEITVERQGVGEEIIRKPVPATHRIVDGNREFVFDLTASDRQGHLDISLRVCDYP